MQQRSAASREEKEAQTQVSCSTSCTCSGRPVAYPGTNEKSAANCLVWGSVKAQVLVTQSLQVLCMALSLQVDRTIVKFSPIEASVW